MKNGQIFPSEVFFFNIIRDFFLVEKWGTLESTSAKTY